MLKRRNEFVEILKSKDHVSIAIYSDGRWEVIPPCQTRTSAVFHYSKWCGALPDENIVGIIQGIETRLERLEKLSIASNP